MSLSVAALYNEIEPFACDWLENLARAGHIPDGKVERRSIVDLRPEDVRDFEQAHFFAGIAGWAHALRLAGWPDDLPVWTGSCPCQPFSSAGRRKGFNDARHLWPEWFRLIDACRPPVVFGEQVASPDGLAWLDSVQADLEGAGYAFRAFDLCAAGVGAPHIRQRLYFVAVADGERLEGLRLHLRERRSRPAESEAARGGEAGGVVADSYGSGWREGAGAPGQDGKESRDDRVVGDPHVRAEEPLAFLRGGASAEPQGGSRTLAQPDPGRCGTQRLAGMGSQVGRRFDPDTAAEASDAGLSSGLGDAGRARGRRDAGGVPGPEGEGEGERIDAGREPDESIHAGARNPWHPVEWLPCRDGKLRPTQPGLLPLADGVPGRVGRLRAYGNAIVPELAATFIEAVVDCLVEE